MSSGISFKQYERQRRQATVETDFSKGMMFTTGAVEFGYFKTLVNYSIYNEGSSLIPRAGLRVSDLLLPNVVLENPDGTSVYHTDENITIQAAKECVEADGNTYRQTILGKVDTASHGTIWASTSKKEVNTVSCDEINYSLNVNLASIEGTGKSCNFFSTVVDSIHKMPLESDLKVSSVVGTFAFGNSFYFMNYDEACLSRTYFDTVSKTYKFQNVTPKQLNPSEAVTYGYNMLLGSKAYDFVNKTASSMQLTGILPYRDTGNGAGTSELLMTPKKNEDLILKCFFEGPLETKYKFVWEWRPVGNSNWESIQTLEKSSEYTFTADTQGNINETVYVSFKAPAEDIMIRVSAYKQNGAEWELDQAMAVGFNFTLESYGTSVNVEQVKYDLSSAKGMVEWKNRLVVWGVTGTNNGCTSDPTILFMSDVNEPTYFPYPNNIAIYDEPIVSVKPFMDSLLIFTVNKIYQLSLNSDGVSWSSVVVQSNLNIEPWDRELIQIVKNMVFFKSGNYYFMMVPKAQSTTGELILAPISSSITDLFNNFEKNVYELLSDTFDYRGSINLVNYYNFLDYEDIHNIYVFRYVNSEKNSVYFGEPTLTGDTFEGFLHFDIVYNTSDRTWRIYTFESAHFLFPYKSDVTKAGVLACTNRLKMGTEASAGVDARVIQLFEFDALHVEDFGFPEGVKIEYDNTNGFVLNLASLKTTVLAISNSITDYYHFFNWQFLDTGFRADAIYINKRYRELQFLLNDKEGASLEFSMDYSLEGDVRMNSRLYEVEYAVDEEEPGKGVLYLQSTIQSNVPVEGNEIPNVTELGVSSNAWQLDRSVFPEVSLWKVRVPISGKGLAPRLKLLSRNAHLFELLSINWIYRVMYMR
jgi:hypothetical protein